MSSGGGAVTVMGHGMASVAVVVMAKMLKNLYTRLYIYAKCAAKMYKYTVVTALFRGVNSGFFSTNQDGF